MSLALVKHSPEEDKIAVVLHTETTNKQGGNTLKVYR